MFLSMLCTKLGLEPKIKVFTLVKYYNFAYGCTAMQTLYDIVPLRSIMQLENDNLHYNHDLEANWVQVTNTKIIPYDILKLLKVLLGFHKHFTH